ncbi:TetR/AcrR family transcriptional regulator [Conexibacter arvalis]|uniref:AcrR family transcriptional regulator n=1 Tax=Conexibacter arvalis TaxID=912552 RepID=A0A840IBR6_9ACTN|nr:TetR/AcrR family transcriptional regulator [Conexibacter arvalis]MBB4662367.1 AcrR family transcriptional regulator [Conexibacter arvalis]
MTGLRERKRRRTFTAIHDAAMRLFAERGYADVTVAEIAEAAEVSRATVFTYYPAKEDIVLGEAPVALEALQAALADAGDQAAVVAAVRAWLRTLVGWVEPDLVLQVDLAAQVPAIAAARSRLLSEIETTIATALARTMEGDRPLAARLVAGSLTSALVACEQEAAQRMKRTRRALPAAEIDALLDAAVAFVDGGLASLAAASR